MRKTLLLIGLAVVVLLSASYVISRTRSSSDRDAGAQTPSSSASVGADLDTLEVQEGTIDVDIKEFLFSPATLKVKVGTTVTWTNKDTMAHSVVSVGTDELRSEVLSNSGMYAHTFSTVGIFSYRCGVHPYMQGTVQVVE